MSGSLWAARRIASFANFDGTPSISNRTLAGANDGNPVIGRAFAFTHTGFGGLLRDGLVREQTQPDLAATLDETRHGDTGRFDLAVGDITALHDLEAEVAERNIGAAPRLAAHAAALLLAVFDLLGQEA